MNNVGKGYLYGGETSEMRGIGVMKKFGMHF